MPIHMREAEAQIERLEERLRVQLTRFDALRAENGRLTALTEIYDRLDLERIAEIERLTAARAGDQQRLFHYEAAGAQLIDEKAELLAALKKTVPALERGISASAYDAVLRETRAAIAKAEGK